MDNDELQSRLDTINLMDVGRGFRIVELPTRLRAELKETGLPDLIAVRFSKMNPRRRSKAEQIVIRAYQRDLQNKEILSNQQVLALVAERGEWTPEMTARKDKLEKEIAQRMSILWAQGIKDNLSDWAESLADQSGEFRSMIEKAEDKTVEQKAEAQALFDRWLAFSPEMQAEYNEKHAASQKREVYSHDVDFSSLMDLSASLSVEAVVLVQEIEVVLKKLQKFVELTELRKEQAQLVVKHASIFADTVESRRTNNEELARLFVSTEKLESADENAKPVGPIVKDFDAIFDMPDDVIRWLVDQCFLFHTNVPPEGRDFLETFGFTEAEGPSKGSASPASAESPAPQSSSPDSQAATETVVNSSEPVAA